MKNAATLAIILLLSLGLVNTVSAAVGDTVIHKWKDGKQGAVSLAFDDSLGSHVDFVIPRLMEKGLVGSFWINPSGSTYAYGITTWEDLAGRAGMELCNHTMHHSGASAFEEADWEVGECARKIWSLNPPDKSKLLMFLRGGGTEWAISDEEWGKLQERYHCIHSRGDGDGMSSDKSSAEEMINVADDALEGVQRIMAFHGVGPYAEWLICRPKPFDQLLDFLVDHRDELWNGTCGDVYKYTKERETAKVELKKTGEKKIELELKGKTDPELYDYPLSLTTEVPAAWEHCRVSQGKRILGVFPVKDGVVSYSAVPGAGKITLEPCGMDTTSPKEPAIGKFNVKEHLLSASWKNAVDEESGVQRYWYRLGTTLGGDEVLGWIDNGLSTEVSTSRTNLSLSRGATYYLTVKAVNGAGLETQVVSGGAQVPGTRRIYFEKKEELVASLGGEQVRESHDLRAVKDEAYISFRFKLSKDFSVPKWHEKEQPAVDILSLQGKNNEPVGTLRLVSQDGKTNMYLVLQEDTEWRCMPHWPHISGGRITVSKSEWHRVDIHARSAAQNGGVELWLDGKKRGSYLTRPTAKRSVGTLMIGAVNVKGDCKGTIYLDNLVVSDSYLGHAPSSPPLDGGD